jgi:hypothetical protein
MENIGELFWKLKIFELKFSLICLTALTIGFGIYYGYLWIKGRDK